MELTREKWTQTDYDALVEYLKTLADDEYKKFSDGLVPDTEFSFGIRVPVLRKTAKDIAKGNYTVDYGGIVASSLMIIVPELIFYGLFQKNIVEGMTAGAVKG